LRHDFRDSSFSFGEKRTIYGFKEGLSSFGSKISSGFGKVKTGVKWVTLPARMVMWPVTKPLSLAYKGVKGLNRVAKTPFYTAKHIARGVVWETGAKSFWHLLKAPLMDVKINLVDQFRAVTKGVFTLPVDIVKAPFRFFGKAMESVKKTRCAIKGIFKGMWDLKPMEALGSAKNALIEPFKMPLAASWAAVGPMTTPFIKIGHNAIRSKTQYLSELNEFQKQLRNGISYTLGAYGAAKADASRSEAESAKAEEEAKKVKGKTDAETKAKAEEEAKKEAQKGGGKAGEGKKGDKKGNKKDKKPREEQPQEEVITE